LFVLLIHNIINQAKLHTGGRKMAKMKKSFFILLTAVVISGSALFSGCGGGVSEEQMQMLFDCRAEVESLQSQVNAKQDERASLQRQIADRDSQIRQFQNDLSAVRTRCP
jgi:septal ring factor EnvC (AmiA/AmiB activator)